MRMSSGLMTISMLSSISGETIDAGKRSVPPLGLIEGRNAHQAVHADLALQKSEGVFAVHGERRGLQARPLRPPGSRRARSQIRCRSAHRKYMRSSMSAQSCDSVPPAPG